MRTIGHFEILEKLGAGGMGEVFKARDTRLNRFVAIKFLPEAATAAARDRFQREALAIAALNHPHICTLHEAGEEHGRPYLVMELLEGETLYARLARGPVAPAQIAQWGSEIADALQAAHAKGILHRDLKPGNIFITQRGSVKVLDFGLAQIAAAAAAEADAATITGAMPGGGPAAGPLTSPGTALGTYAYMSPEQARGEPTDARSDLFSLGVVLYEMAGGRPPFQGRTSADLTAAILMLSPPPPSTLRPEIPARLDDIIAQCLEKDPELRYQAAADLRVSLRRLAGGSSSSHGAAASGSGPALAASQAPASRSGSAPASAPGSAAGSAPGSAIAGGAARPGWLWPALAAAVVIVAAGAWWGLRRHAPLAPVELQLHPLTFTGTVQDAAISPDGKFLAYTNGEAAGTALHLLSVATGSDVTIVPPGGDCCQAPTFSPDGSMIYFTEHALLKAVPVLGGTVRDIAANACSGAAFSPDGKRIAYETVVKGGDALTVAAPDGSATRILNDPRPGGFDSRCWLGGPSAPDAPAWSPDGRWIAVGRSEGGADVTDHIELISTAEGTAHLLSGDIGESASDLAWLPDGSGVLFTVSMPATAPAQVWELTYPGGKLLQLTHDLQGFDRVSVAAQAGGALSLIHGNPQYSVWRQSKPGGAFEQLPGGGATGDGQLGLAWMPEGSLLSARSPGGKTQIWIEGGAAPARPVPADNLPPGLITLAGTPDGQILVDAQTPGQPLHIWRLQPNGSGLTDLTPNLNALGIALAGGGKSVAFINIYATGKDSHQRIWTVPTAGGPARELWNGEVYVNFILGMPDQRHVLAMAVDPKNPAGGDLVMQLSLDGAAPIFEHPRESHGRFGGPYGVTPDGRALTSVITDGNVGNIWAAPFDGTPLHEITHFTDLTIAAYAFAPDGRLAVSRGSQNSDAVLATGLAARPH